jgi:hypothetical protein
MELNKIICPKCGHKQTVTDECARCGVIFSKFAAVQKKVLKRGLRNDHHTNSRQKIRKVLAKALIIITIAIPLAFMVLFWSAFLPHEIKTGEHLDSVDWLPSSASDVSFTKRGGFGWIKNYECLIPEDDFYLLSAEEGWDLEREGNILFYEKRHLNGGGVTVHYNTDSQRLSVSSNHN